MTSAFARPRPEDVSALYESRFGASYDMRASCWERTLSRRAGHQFHQRLRSLPSVPLRVLDLGCGTGRNLGRLHAANVALDSYRGIDGSRTMLAAAVRNHPYSLAEFDLVDDLRTATEDRYDLVLCTWVLSHLSDPVRTLREALGLVAPGGHLVIAALTSTPHPIGAMLARNYRRRLHASPIEPSILAEAQPLHLHTGLFGLTTIAHYHHSLPHAVPPKPGSSS